MQLSRLTGLLWASSSFAVVSAFPVIENGKHYDSRELDKRFAPFPVQVYPGQNWTKTPIKVFYYLLNTQPDPDWDLINDLCTFDVNYISLTYDNPVLHSIMPWAGTHQNTGPQVFVDIFTQVGQYWKRGPFSIDFIFGDGGNVTAWGQFTATSRTFGTTVSSPWAARAQVNEDMKVFDFQWMEDTSTTALSFGDPSTKKTYKSNPAGGETVA